ncbi:polysaccharide biosynthesis/export family protein [Paraburkholderia sp. GAS32]|uniref:polysaccharide biosynthesis/export family protein n=1 Tax=Paraburkholderia sp. GAS32 TaxID=3035129 RepID=UPI003D1C31E6
MRWVGRLFATVAIGCLLQACVMAPGMRMHEPSNVSMGSADRQNVSPAQVPITEINASTLKDIKVAIANKGSQDFTLISDAPELYRLGVGDVLQITVWDHPELATSQGLASQQTLRPADPSSGFIVDQAGNIQFPFAGSIYVKGLRPEQVRASLVEVLSKTFRNPQVTVRIGSFRSQQIYVDGEVHTPGVEVINDIPMTLYEAVSRAGGFSAAADQSRMTLIRDGVSHSIDLPEIIARGANPSKIILKNGDVLKVLARDDNGVYVMGEVAKPVLAIPMRSGKLTLSDAVSQAGSINSNSADAKQLYVIRDSTTSEPMVYHLDASSPVSMVLANQFELEPKDIVYVDSNGLVRFSRVLSLLLPGINAGLTAAIVTK